MSFLNNIFEPIKDLKYWRSKTYKYEEEIIRLKKQLSYQKEAPTDTISKYIKIRYGVLKQDFKMLSKKYNALAMKHGEVPIPIADIEYVIKTVCEFYQVTEADFIGISRKGYLPIARHTVSYILCERKMSLKEIGRRVKRHHSSIIHGRDNVIEAIAMGQVTHEYIDMVNGLLNI